jgi:hypothetical protein
MINLKRVKDSKEYSQILEVKEILIFLIKLILKKDLQEH